MRLFDLAVVLCPGSTSQWKKPVAVCERRRSGFLCFAGRSKLCPLPCDVFMATFL